MPQIAHTLLPYCPQLHALTNNIVNTNFSAESALLNITVEGAASQFSGQVHRTLREAKIHAEIQLVSDLLGGKGKGKTTENKLLNLYFPNACQVLFVPLWNATNSQWFAGCFCWNTVETRVFSPSVEISSVLGFSSSIMAEFSRIQSLISDRQKSDFIGSIS